MTDDHDNHCSSRQRALSLGVGERNLCQSGRISARDAVGDAKVAHTKGGDDDDYSS